MGLHFLLLIQVGNTEGDRWDVVTTDKVSFELVVEAINNQDSDEIENSIDNATRYDLLGEYLDKEEAIQLAQQYADEHIVTIYVMVPQT